MIKAIVISTFVHGASTYRPGDQAEFSPPVFASLAGHGLVQEAPAPSAEQTTAVQRTQRAARTPSNKKAPEPDNKGAATGATGTAAVLPSPAGPAASSAVEPSAGPTADAASTAGASDAAPDA
ncbi:MAG: hypothetical protein Q8N13_10510 [Acidovorax sp.]|nr:hypothetical protein [Acidovorax sp.]